jgi:hypothetical protein
VFSLKQYERFSLHMERARTYRDAVDKLVCGGTIRSLKEEADRRNKSQFPRLEPLRLHRFWLGLYSVIGFLGVALTILALFYPATSSPESPNAWCPIVISGSH